MVEQIQENSTGVRLLMRRLLQVLLLLLPIVVCCIFIEPAHRVNIYLPDFYAVKLLAWTVLIIPIWVGLLSFTTWDRHGVFLGRAIILLISLGLVSAVSGGTSLYRAIPALGASVLIALTVFVYYAALRSRLISKDDLYASLLVATLIPCLTGLAEACGIEVPWSKVPRPSSMLGNRNELAQVMFFGVIICFASPLAKRFSIIPLATIFFLVSVLCRTRLTWVAYGVVGFALLFLWRQYQGGLRRIFFLYVASALSAVCLVATVPFAGLRWHHQSPYLTSLRSIVDVTEGSGLVRIEHYQAGLFLLSRAPLMGVGPGGWEANIPLMRADNSGLLPFRGYDFPTPIADVIRIVCEFGLVGTILLGFVCYLYFRKLWRNLAASQSDQVLLCLGLLGLIVQSFGDIPLWRVPTSCLYSVLIGISLFNADGSSAADQLDNQIGDRRRPACYLFLLSTCLLLYLLPLSLRSIGYYALNRPGGLSVPPPRWLLLYPPAEKLTILAGKRSLPLTSCCLWGNAIERAAELSPLHAAQYKSLRKCQAYLSNHCQPALLP